MSPKQRAVAEWVTAVAVIRDTLIDFGDIVKDEPDAVAAAVIARLAGHEPPLLLHFANGEKG